MPQSTQPEPQSPASKHISKVSVLWKLSTVVPFSFVYTQNDFVGEHPFFKKYFFAKVSVHSRGWGLSAFCPWVLPFHCPLGQCPTAYWASVPLSAPAFFCLRTFSGHKNPLWLCTGKTRTARELSLLFPAVLSRWLMEIEVCIPPALSMVSPKKWLVAALPFMSSLLMSHQCFLGLLPQQTIYTWFLVSGTAYGRIWTKTVIFLSLFF